MGNRLLKLPEEMHFVFVWYLINVFITKSKCCKGVIDILEGDGDRLQIYLIFRYNFRRGGILIVGFSGIFYRVTE